MDSILEIKDMHLPCCSSVIVKSIDDILNKDFYYYNNSYLAPVPVAKIIGTSHPSYQNISWIEMLSNLQRHIYDFDEKRVINAINDETIVEHKYVDKYDDFYYINGGGNHRLCQAKMLELESVVCDVSEYKFNKLLFDTYEALRNIGGTCLFFHPDVFKKVTINNVKFLDDELFIDDILKLIDLRNSIKLNKINSLYYKLLFLRKKHLCLKHFDVDDFTSLIFKKYITTNPKKIKESLIFSFIGCL